MAMRDKNGENADERTARKFFDGTLDRVDCNCVQLDTEHTRTFVLHSTWIATLSQTGLRIRGEDHAFSGSRLTKSRKHALKLEAKRRGIAVLED